MLMILLLCASADELRPPFLARAGGEVIDVGGHAAPLVADFDGDGLEDLLVGQNAQGLLALYRNHGRCGAPDFGALEWVRAGGERVSVPPG